MRLKLQEILCADYGFKIAFRENMPNSDITADVSKTDEQLFAEMNSGAKSRIKKAMKSNIAFTVATPDQYKSFYDKRLETSGNK